jgi:hypothetical protein
MNHTGTNAVSRGVVPDTIHVLLRYLENGRPFGQLDLVVAVRWPYSAKGLRVP